MFYISICNRSYPSLLDSVSCVRSYGANSPRNIIIHLPHNRLSFTLFINDKSIPVSAFVLFCSCGCANVPDGCRLARPYNGHSKWLEATSDRNTRTVYPLHPTSQHLRFRNPRVQAKPADLLKHSLAKVKETTLHPGVGKVALNGRDQGCFEITNKFRRIKLDAKFFRYGMEHFKYPAIRGQIFPNSQTIYDEWQFTPHEHMKGKQLLVPGWGNLKRPIPTPAVTLSQQPHTSLSGKN
ncbi:hypothetical protein T10_5406 [Trichinella papuae]|uniref:Uncharacterized protein n=1 Tax=Trichinella papuae TaxID=268474 RepID=A0A0V1M4F6_9BILA|nr:hypothetical protein T10_5406 [Trichinella papuae]